MASSSSATILAQCNPFTIFGAIIQIGVFAFNCKPIVIPMAHSPFSECLKVVYPFVADADASCSIVSIRTNFWIITSRLHIAPTSI